MSFSLNEYLTFSLGFTFSIYSITTFSEIISSSIESTFILYLSINIFAFLLITLSELIFSCLLYVFRISCNFLFVIIASEIIQTGEPTSTSVLYCAKVNITFKF